MQEVGFWNGKFCVPSQATTSVEDRGYNFGDGVYDVGCAFNGVLWKPEQHVDRLFKSMEMMEIKSPYTKDEILDLLQQAINKIDAKSAMVYFQVTRGTAKRSHTYSDEMQGNFMLIARKKPTFTQYREGDAKVISVEDDRWRRCDIKSLNLIPNIMAATKAKRQGCFEAVLVRDGIAAEGTASNLWRVKDGVIYTEPLSNLILGGITRRHIIQYAKQLGYEVREQQSTLDDFYQSDEAFMTSSTKIVLPITHIDHHYYGTKHPIANALLRTYMEDIEKVCGAVIQPKGEFSWTNF